MFGTWMALFPIIYYIVQVRLNTDILSFGWSWLLAGHGMIIAATELSRIMEPDGR